MKPATLAVIALGLGAAYLAGSGKRKRRWEHEEEAEGRQISDRMTFDATCTDLLVRVDSAKYDMRITKMYWDLRKQGFLDPAEISAEILHADSPQCTWPANEGASLRAKYIWELVYGAVKNYRMLEVEGKLKDLPPMFGTGWAIE